jgi:hypothetical protein
VRFGQDRPLYRALLADIAVYLSEMEVPQRYIELMSETASNDIKWLSSDEALSILETPSTAEWVAATCGAITSQDVQEYTELMGQLRAQLSDKDLAQIESRLDANMAKAERISKCGREKKAQYRDAMAPPQVAEAVAPSQGPSNNILRIGKTPFAFSSSSRGCSVLHSTHQDPNTLTRETSPARSWLERPRARVLN